MKGIKSKYKQYYKLNIIVLHAKILQYYIQNIRKRYEIKTIAAPQAEQNNFYTQKHNIVTYSNIRKRKNLKGIIIKTEMVLQAKHNNII